MKLMDGARILTVMALVAGLAACSKKEQPAASKAPATEKQAAAGQAAVASATGAGQATEAAAAEGADLNKVEERTGGFQNMLDSLRSYAGAGVEMSTNGVDIESFVKGKSDRDLLDFAEQVRWKSPYAAKQVAAYLLRNSTDPRIRMDAADLHTSLVPSLGDEEDRELALESFEMLKEYFADENLRTSMSAQERQRLIVLMQNHAVDLILDPAEYYQMAQAIRQHAKTDLERSCADNFEAESYIWGGKTGDIEKVRPLYEQIRARGVYHEHILDKSSCEYWLGLSDAELHANASQVAEFMQQADKEGIEEWQKTQGLSLEERLKIYSQ